MFLLLGNCQDSAETQCKEWEFQLPICGKDKISKVDRSGLGTDGSDLISWSLNCDSKLSFLNCKLRIISAFKDFCEL